MSCGMPRRSIIRSDFHREKLSSEDCAGHTAGRKAALLIYAVTISPFNDWIDNFGNNIRLNQIVILL